MSRRSWPCPGSGCAPTPKAADRVTPILDAGGPHPRTYGSTASVLGTYVRERNTLTLETAIAKLSGVSAARLGLRDQGVLREGAFADLVVLDPGTVAGRRDL